MTKLPVCRLHGRQQAGARPGLPAAGLRPVGAVRGRSTSAGARPRARPGRDWLEARGRAGRRPPGHDAQAPAGRLQWPAAEQADPPADRGGHPGRAAYCRQPGSCRARRRGRDTAAAAGAGGHRLVSGEARWAARHVGGQLRRHDAPRARHGSNRPGCRGPVRPAVEPPAATGRAAGKDRSRAPGTSPVNTAGRRPWHGTTTRSTCPTARQPTGGSARPAPGIVPLSWPKTRPNCSPRGSPAPKPRNAWT
jgi:hypothetical protein